MIKIKNKKILISARIKTIYANSGDYKELDNIHNPRYEVTKCEIITNNGTVFVVYTDSEEDWSMGHKKFSYTGYERCKIGINRITEEDTGIWKVKTTVNSTMNHVVSYDIKIRKVRLLKIKKSFDKNLTKY